MIIDSYREKSNFLHTSNYLADSWNTLDVSGTHTTKRQRHYGECPTTISTLWTRWLNYQDKVAKTLEAPLAERLIHAPNIFSFWQLARKYTASRNINTKISQIIEEGNTSFVFNHISSIALNIKCIQKQ